MLFHVFSHSCQKNVFILTLAWEKTHNSVHNVAQQVKYVIAEVAADLGGEAAAFYLRRAGADVVLRQLLQKPSASWSLKHIPVQSMETLFLVAVSDSLSPKPDFFNQQKPRQALWTIPGRKGVTDTTQNADALPNTSVKQNPSWLGLRTLF